MRRINIGCGMTPTKGWRNIDNSWSILFAQFGSIGNLLYKIGLIEKDTLAYIKFCRENEIERANVAKKIPAEAGSIDVLYTSHMLEHLDREEALIFLQEALRVLKPAGIIRVAVPNLGKKIEEYIGSRDADKFIESLHMGVSRPKTFAQKLRMLVVGTRHHQWMYDGNSLSNLLIQIGFEDPKVLEPGQTTIANSGELNLSERVDESLYVEARKSII